MSTQPREVKAIAYREIVFFEKLKVTFTTLNTKTKGFTIGFKWNPDGFRREDEAETEITPPPPARRGRLSDRWPPPKGWR